MSKVKILYIMGEGRSGSTLFDLILSNQQNVFGAGELWSFFSNDTAATGRCSCGNPYVDCPFWQAVKLSYLQKLEGRSLESVNQSRLQYERWRVLLWHYLHFPSGKKFEQYCEDNLLLYNTIRDISGCSVIVDSTKLAGRAFSLSHCKSLDLYILHLVRDGRGVLWSRIRDLQREKEIKRAIWRTEPFWTTLSWGTKNLWARMLANRMKDRYLLVHYEDLVSNPEDTLGEVTKFCGVDFSSARAKLAEGDSFLAGHQIGGNQRTRLGEKLALQADNEWRTNLRKKDRFLFWLVTGWIAKRLGYSK